MGNLKSRFHKRKHDHKAPSGNLSSSSSPASKSGQNDAAQTGGTNPNRARATEPVAPPTRDSEPATVAPRGRP
ncbi:unnamed protein product [Adineta ricciae]|nr:unnamed protein product [Adineta ricciae]